jgi:hypothetical protein
MLALHVINIKRETTGISLYEFRRMYNASDQIIMYYFITDRTISMAANVASDESRCLGRNYWIGLSKRGWLDYDEMEA